MSFAFTRAWRSIVHAPLVSFVIVLCIGLGVGPTTTVFTWMDQLVRHPLPAVKSMDRLVSVMTREQARDDRVSYPDYLDWRDAATELRGLAAFGMRQFGVRASNEPAERTQSAWGLLVSDNYFDVLGVRASAGRMFLVGESQAAGQTPHAVVSHRMAVARFGGDEAAIGRGIRINDVPFTIVGVAPRNFSGTIAGLAFDVWVPVTMHPVVTGDAGGLTSRALRWLQTFGRLRDGVLPADAGAELAAISSHLAQTYPEDTGREAVVTPLDTGLARRLERLFSILMGITALVTLIVCTNVANLLILRGTARRYEIGMCLALGASRRQVLSQLVIEAAMLSSAGAAAGVILARWAQALLPALMPASPLPLALEARIDARTLVFALTLSAAMVLVFALVPAIHTLRGAVLPNLRTARGGGARRDARLRAGLVATQLALSLAALAGAGMFLRAGAKLSAIDRGLGNPHEVLLISTDFEQVGYHTPEARIQAAERLVSNARSVPGVRDAALATFVPLGFGGYSAVPAGIAGYAPKPNEDMMVLSNHVSPDYFRTLGIRILQGRPIDGRDTRLSAPAVVVNDAFAQRFMADRAVTGSRIELAGRPFTVVGIAANGKYRFDELDKPSPPFVYFAYAQSGRSWVTLHVRAGGPLEQLMPPLRRAFAEVNPALPLDNPTTLDEHTSLPLFPVRVGTAVLSSLGAFAILLATAGLYGVVGYRVTQRWKEFAVRTALGCSPSGLMRLIVRDGLRQVVVGLGLGIVLALLATRVIATRLPQAPSSDPMVVVAAAAVLAAVSLAAAMIPALRAWRVDPASVLRSE